MRAAARPELIWGGLAVAGLLGVLALVAVNLAGALGRVSVLQEQIVKWGDSAAVATESYEAVLADGRELVALQDSIESADSAAAAVARAAVDEASSETDAALGVVLELADQYPVIRDALVLAQTELQEEREDRRVERATNAAALFESQQRNRTLAIAYEDLAEASEAVAFSLNTRLDLALQTIEEQQRALAPSFFVNLIKNVEILVAGLGAGAGACKAFC